MNRALTAVLVAAAVLALAAPPGLAAPPDRCLIHLQGPPQQARNAVAQAVAKSGGKVLRAFDLIPVVAIEVPGPALAGLLNNPNLKGVIGLVEVDAVIRAVPKPDKPGKPPKDDPPPPPPQVTPWGVDRIDADLAWAATRGAGVKVVVIDSGIDKDHPDLQANIKGGVNYVRQKGRVDPNAWDDDNGHGTHVAGTIAAVDNTLGVIGVAPSASLYAAKALDKRGNGYVSDLISALDWAAANGMHIANMSLSTTSDVQALHDACDAAVAAGVVLVAAAGNAGDGNAATDEIEYPAAYSAAIAVAASDSADSVPGWSNSGPHVDVAAPGVNIYSTTKGGGYGVKDGTSMATPHVSGVAALVLAARPAGADTSGDGTISPAEMCAWLITKADDIEAAGFDKESGNGLVDAEESTTGTQTNP